MQSLLLLRQRHSTCSENPHNPVPSLVEALLAERLNLLHTLHSLQRGGHQVAVIFHRAVASLLELKCGVLGEMSGQIEISYNTDILSIRTSERLRPADLSGITTQVEVLSAFRSAEAENLKESKEFHAPIPYYRYGRIPFHVLDKWDPNRSSTFLFSFLLIQVEMELQPNGRMPRKKKSRSAVLRNLCKQQTRQNVQ